MSAMQLGPQHQVAFKDPLTHHADVREAFGLEIIHTVGHTEGHIMLKWKRHGNVLFCGELFISAAFEHSTCPPTAVHAVSADRRLIEGHT